MQRILKIFRHGITSYHVKIIAMFFMTIDHIGAYGVQILSTKEYYSLFRILGRIAAPLFLYMLTESVRYTHSKISFLFRLYIGAVATNLFITFTNYIFGDVIGTSIPSNIFFTYFYIALFIIIIEKIVLEIKSKKWLRCTVIISLLVLFMWLVHAISVLTLEHVFSKQLYSDVCRSFLKSPIYVEYTPAFILLGILLYFAREKKFQIIIFALFCAVSYSNELREKFFMTPLVSFFGYPQYWMFLAIPFIVLYNGKRGKEQKAFFYLYYPIHIFLIKLIVSMIAG